MGRSFGVKCTNCGYSHHVNVGTGDIQDFSYMLQFVNINDKKKIENFIENRKVESFSYYFDLFHCENCSKFFNSLVFSISFPENNEIISTSNLCEDCTSKPKSLDYRTIENYPCPKCEEVQLQEENIQMLWD